MDLQQIAQFSQVITGFGTLFVLYKTLTLSSEIARDSARLSREIAEDSARRSREIARESKRADVLMECNRRFDELWGLRPQYNPDELTDPKVYYHRFWSLQKDQYEFYLRGFVSDNAFRYWMNSRSIDWHKDEKLGGMSFQEGWSEVQKRWGSSDFNLFMNSIFCGDPDKALLDLKRRAHDPDEDQERSPESSPAT